MQVIIYKAKGGQTRVLVRPGRFSGLPAVLLAGTNVPALREDLRQVLDDLETRRRGAGSEQRPF